MPLTRCSGRSVGPEAPRPHRAVVEVLVARRKVVPGPRVESLGSGVATRDPRGGSTAGAEFERIAQR
jgi:hypothetical protein